MRLQDVMECCEHTKPVVAPCLECFRVRLDSLGRRWQAEGKEAAEDEIKSLNDRLTRMTADYERIKEANAGLIDRIGKYEANVKLAGERIRDAERRASDFQSQYQAVMAVRSLPKV